MRGHAGGGMKPGFTPTGGATAMAGPGRGGKTDFVICEICDGYIKDLEQLRNHMMFMHKVSKILLALSSMNLMHRAVCSIMIRLRDSYDYRF